MGEPRQRAADILSFQHQSRRSGSRGCGCASETSIATTAMRRSSLVPPSWLIQPKSSGVPPEAPTVGNGSFGLWLLSNEHRTQDEPSDDQQVLRPRTS